MLFFSPLAHLRDHALLEASIAELFCSAGASVEVLRCSTELFGGCALHVNKPPASQRAICQTCTYSARTIDKGSRYRVLTLDQTNLNEEQEALIDALSTFSNEELLSYRIDGVQIGRFWSYDLALAYKDPTIFREPGLHGELVQSASAGLRAYFAAKNRIIDFQPNVVLVYSRQYSANRSFAAAAQQLNIPVLNIHHRGTLPDRFGSFSASLEDWSDKPITKSSFAESMKLPLVREEVVELSVHFRDLFRSKSPFVYSTGRKSISGTEIRRHLGLRSGKVVLIALSSPDEPVAAVGAGLFPPMLRQFDDFEGLRTMLEMVKLRRDLDFVVRPHPRLYPNRRDQVTSPDAQRISTLLEKEKAQNSNLFISWPWDDFGLYDLALVTNVVITGRSSAAHELAVLGIPAIYIDRSANPVEVLTEETCPWMAHKTLAEQLQSALDSGFSSEQVKAHLRYAATALIRLVVRVDRPPAEITKNTFAKKLVINLERALGVPKRYYRSSHNPERWLFNKQTSVSEGLAPSRAVAEWPIQLSYSPDAGSENSEDDSVQFFLDSVMPLFDNDEGAGLQVVADRGLSDKP